eukprot:snap_masked-scaffold_2-processed-gene-22.12-mRNA-1 protein AED:1.00 eAED:1.00 QI:0/0/0/0/1/1/2/0/95
MIPLRSKQQRINKILYGLRFNADVHKFLDVCYGIKNYKIRRPEDKTDGLEKDDAKRSIMQKSLNEGEKNIIYLRRINCIRGGQESLQIFAEKHKC